MNLSALPDARATGRHRRLAAACAPLAMRGGSVSSPRRERSTHLCAERCARWPMFLTSFVLWRDRCVCCVRACVCVFSFFPSTCCGSLSAVWVGFISFCFGWFAVVSQSHLSYGFYSSTPRRPYQISRFQLNCEADGLKQSLHSPGASLRYVCFDPLHHGFPLVALYYCCLLPDSKATLLSAWDGDVESLPPTPSSSCLPPAAKRRPRQALLAPCSSCQARRPNLLLASTRAPSAHIGTFHYVICYWPRV